MNYYPFHIGDYASATRHLSWDEDLAYRRLIDAYYTKEAPIPADKRAAYRLVCATSDSQREAVDVVLAEFFVLSGEVWVHERCEEEIHAATVKREKARASAMIGVQSREQKNAELRRLRMKDAKERGSHTQEEWVALASLCGEACVRCGSTEKIQKDHIVPIYQGGDDSIENLQPLCRTCNSAKGPENIDHRPANWKESVKRTLSERSANAENKSANTGELFSERLAPNPNPNPNISTDVDIKEKRAPRFDAQAHLSSLGVDQQVAKDWLAHRKAKKATPTMTAIDGIVREAAKARIALSDALSLSCQRGWVGFEAGWITKDQGFAARPINGRQAAISNYAAQAAAARGDHEQSIRDITGEAVRVA